MIHYITANGIGNAWVANELREVQRDGIPFTLHAMRKPTESYHTAEWAQTIQQQTRPIYPLPVGGMMVSLLAAPFLFGRRFFSALGNAIFGKRENPRARIAAMAHLLVACHWARGLRREQVTHIHSQWAHSCATIGMYGARLLNKSFSFTGHGADVWRDRVALEDKIRQAEFIICISNFHRELYLKHGARPEQLHIAYCGIDPEIFFPRPHERRAGEPFHIRSSGRLVEKKGFTYLIDACRILMDRGVEFDCVIGGSGPLEDDLRRQIRDMGVGANVTLPGQMIKQEDIGIFMQGGDLYVLPCVWASDQDADGLPQMLMEAMACGLPVLSTRLVGIPDLVIDGQTGLLVEPNNAAELADAIQSMMDDPQRARRLAEAGLKHLHDNFDIRTCLYPLLNQYRRKLNMPEHATGSSSGGAADMSRQAGVMNP